ncbi:MAG: hypothetical protein FWC44_03660 [Methanomassiliicoccaceae archaeon]|nr:hypothetical protein [Methanomassiliicoccaceae archaeon]
MVVKSKRGRRRYIVFEISPNLRRDALISSLVSVKGENPPHLIQMDHGKAVVRCTPQNREDAVNAVSRADPKAVSLVTSGTLRKIRELYPELKPEKR